MNADSAIQMLREHIAFCGDSFCLSDALRIFNEFYLFLQIDAPPETIDCLNFSAGMMQAERSLRPTFTISRARGLSSIIGVSLVYKKRSDSEFKQQSEHCHSVQESPGFFQALYALDSYREYAKVLPAKFTVDLLNSDEIKQGADRMGLFRILEGDD